MNNLKHSYYPLFIGFLVLSIIGLALTSRLSVQLTPNEKKSSLMVSYSWRDASPENIEQVITAPLEGAFSLIQGVEKVNSVSSNGHGRIVLQLDEAQNLDLLRFEVNTQIRQLYPNFPNDVSYPWVRLNQRDNENRRRPILVYNLIGNTQSSNLFDFGNTTLVPQFGLINGVQEVQIYGGNRLEWHIEYEEDKLRTFEINPVDIKRVLQDHFREEALGIVQQGQDHLFINLNNIDSNRGKDQYSLRLKRGDLEEIPIQLKGCQVLKLKDIAKISLQEQPEIGYFRINGANNIRLAIFPESNVNTVDLAQKVKIAAKEFEALIPGGYELSLEQDNTQYLTTELQKIYRRSILSLFILLSFVLIVYRSFGHLLIVLLSLLANLSISFIFYYCFDVNLHLYALAGFTVSFGIIIDNTIVMMHHISNQKNLRVFPALLASTLTTISALVIVYFLPEKWQLSLLDFSKVIIINLMVSLGVALFLIPALLLKLKVDVIKQVIHFSIKKKLVRLLKFYESLIGHILHRRRLVKWIVLFAFGTPLFFLPQNINGVYSYNKMVQHTWFVDYVRPFLGGALGLFLKHNKKRGYGYQSADETILNIGAKMQNGATPQQMNAVIIQVENFLNQFEAQIDKYTTRISSGQQAHIQITFKKGNQFEFPHYLKGEIQKFCVNMGGVRWNISGVGKGFNNDSSTISAQYLVTMTGYNSEELKRQAKVFAEMLQQNQRVKEVDIEANLEWTGRDLEHFEVAFDQAILASYNINLNQFSDVFQQFDHAIAPDIYSPFNTPIRIVNSQIEQKDLWLLNNQPMPIDSNQVKFADFGNLVKKKINPEIIKENQEYVRKIKFDYIGAWQMGNKYYYKCEAKMKQQLPLGYSIERKFISLHSDFLKQLGALFIIAVLIFFICTITFESFRQAYAILLLIPTSFIGIFLTFSLFDFTFDQGGFTSFILLSGLVVNSLILIINDYNSFRKKQVNIAPLRVYLKAFRHKILPILLTIISTVIGLLPFVIDGKEEVFWFSLAVGTIGGLLFSVLVILFFIPLFVLPKE